MNYLEKTAAKQKLAALLKEALYPPFANRIMGKGIGKSVRQAAPTNDPYPTRSSKTTSMKPPAPDRNLLARMNQITPVPAPIPTGVARMGKAQPFARSNFNRPGPTLGGGALRQAIQASRAPRPMKSLPHPGNTRKALRSGAMSAATKAMPGPAGAMAGAATRVPAIK